MSRHLLLCTAVLACIATSDGEDLVPVNIEEDWMGSDFWYGGLDAGEEVIYTIQFSVESNAADSLTGSTATARVLLYEPQSGVTTPGDFSIALYNTGLLDGAVGSFGEYNLFGEDVVTAGISDCVDDGSGRCVTELQLVITADSGVEFNVDVFLEAEGTGPVASPRVELVHTAHIQP